MAAPRHLAFRILAGVIDGDPARVVQRAALGRQQDRDEAPTHRLSLPLLPEAERPAGGPPDFPGTDMALAIAGLEPRHDRRILFGKPRAEGVGAHRLPLRIA